MKELSGKMLLKPGLPRFGSKGVLVIGDVMLDRYWCGPVSRISPEAPVPVVNIGEIEERPGGAGNVALNLASLGCPVWLVGATGEDEAAVLLKKQLEGAGVHCHFLENGEYPTITKLRILSQRQQLLRIDFEQKFTPDMVAIQSRAESLLKNSKVCLLSDYGKGMIKEPERLVRLARENNIPVIIDPKGNDFSRYRGATLLTPNMSEFEAVAGRCEDEKDLVQKGKSLCHELELDALLVTRSEHGMTLIRVGEEELHFPAQAKEVYDVTGAGDTVIATLAAALTSGQDLPQAVSLSNLAAGAVVAKVGTAAISLPELELAIKNLGGKYQGGGVVSKDQLYVAVEEARSRHESIVFTSGCFDILLPEHVERIKKAKEQGGRLIVAVNDDMLSAQKHGLSPVNSVERRMNAISGLKWVDWVVMLSEGQLKSMLEEIRPDIYVENKSARVDMKTVSNIVETYGGKVISFD